MAVTKSQGWAEGYVMKLRDKAYQVQIDTLICNAEMIADDKVGAGPKRGMHRRKWEDKWDKAYHLAMHDLAWAYKLRRMSWQGPMLRMPVAVS